MKIGRHVCKTRKALELKQQTLADEVGVTAQHISRIELDQAAPSVQTLLKLSRTLGVTTDYLLTGRDTAPFDATGAIRAEPDISATAKRHLIGVLGELRTQAETKPTKIEGGVKAEINRRMTT
jgi:transcriptional regulator with XRE-family HTH domain